MTTGCAVSSDFGGTGSSIESECGGTATRATAMGFLISIGLAGRGAFGVGVVGAGATTSCTTGVGGVGASTFSLVVVE